GDEGNRRLHHRWNTMRARHKRHTVATIAIARELLVLVPGRARGVNPATLICFVDPDGGSSARSDPRCSHEQPTPTAGDARP
ncbi:hypothetical protein ISU10_00005, partial [Nocardioides agariphilus]